MHQSKFQVLGNCINAHMRPHFALLSFPRRNEINSRASFEIFLRDFCCLMDGFLEWLYYSSVPISRQVTTVRKWRRMREPKNRALITIRFRMRRRKRNRKKSSHSVQREESEVWPAVVLDERIYLEHSHLIKRQTMWLLPARQRQFKQNVISNSNNHTKISRMSSFFSENEVAFMYIFLWSMWRWNLPERQSFRRIQMGRTYNFKFIY